MKKTTLLLLAVGLATAINAGAQISTSGSDAATAPALYTPGYTSATQSSTDIGSTPTAEAHVPESATLIYGSIMLVPLAFSLVHVLRRRHVLP